MLILMRNSMHCLNYKVNYTFRNEQNTKIHAFENKQIYGSYGIINTYHVSKYKRGSGLLKNVDCRSDLNDHLL